MVIKAAHIVVTDVTDAIYISWGEGGEMRMKKRRGEQSREQSRQQRKEQSRE